VHEAQALRLEGYLTPEEHQLEQRVRGVHEACPSAFSERVGGGSDERPELARPRGSPGMGPGRWGASVARWSHIRRVGDDQVGGVYDLGSDGHKLVLEVADVDSGAMVELIRLQISLAEVGERGVALDEGDPIGDAEVNQR
jgi:hypothetical protein